MTPIVLHIASLSAKIALLGGLTWIELHLLGRATAASRSRLCSLALIAIVLLTAGELLLSPAWLLKTPVFSSAASASRHLSPLVRPITAGLSASRCIEFIWITGAVLVLLRAMAGRIALVNLRGKSAFVEKVDGLDVRVGGVETPILTGLLRPAIVLPESGHEGWTEEQRRMVLAHELTHFRQGDCWSNLLGQCVRAAFWFHPVVWLLVSRMSREQELTCDEAVIALGHSRHDYAAFLLNSVQHLRSREMFTCAMAGSGARSLKDRFANLLDSRPRPALRRRLVATMALFAVATTMLSVVRPVWSQSKQEQRKYDAYRSGNGVLPPRLLSKVNPEYTEDAKAAKIEGPVILQAVVTSEGVADDIKVVKGLDPGLDRNAVDALTKWTFQPGTKDGAAVAVHVTIEVNFRLK